MTSAVASKAPLPSSTFTYSFLFTKVRSSLSYNFLTRGALRSRVTQIEAERLEETREDREAFRKMLLEEVERQAREKNVHIKLPDGRQL